MALPSGSSVKFKNDFLAYDVGKKCLALKIGVQTLYVRTITSAELSKFWRAACECSGFYY
jgi:hypothetical protein